MAKYFYPAIFDPDEESGYVVILPDLNGSVTQGEDLQEAMNWAVDLVGCWCYGVDEKDYPTPSKAADIDLSEYPNAIVNTIEFDSEKYFNSLNPVSEARIKANITVKKLSEIIGCPYSTAKDLNAGRRMPPVWVQNLIVEKIKSATQK